jgi:hypothetical protein
MTRAFTDHPQAAIHLFRRINFLSIYFVFLLASLMFIRDSHFNLAGFY